MDVVFAVPAWKKDEPIFFVGPCILSNLLNSANISTKLVYYCDTTLGEDYSDFKLFICEYVKLLLSYHPKVVSLYVRSDVTHVQLAVAKLIREIDPEIYIIAGGPQATICAEDLLLNYSSCIDYISRGEGESTIVPLVTGLLSGGVNFAIPGLAWVDADKEIHLNPMPTLLSDNYKLPVDVYDQIQIAKVNTAVIDVGRGCPFSCKFCSTKEVWKQQYRLRDLDDIIATICYFHDKFGTTSFSFPHDNFTVNKNRVKEFCYKLKELPYRISWGCMARVDTVDEELLAIMAEAGCSGILFGIETGSERMQKLCGKNLDLAKVNPIIRCALDLKYKVDVHVIYGFPEETVDDYVQTLDLAVNLARLGIGISFHECCIEKGTEYFQYKNLLTLDTDRIVCDQSTPIGVREMLGDIKKYPDLFANFYHIQTPTSLQFQYSQFFISIFSYYPYTLKYIIDKIRPNNLDLYNKVADIYNSKFNLDSLKIDDYLFSNRQIIEPIYRTIIDILQQDVQSKISEPWILQDLFRYEVELNRVKGGEVEELSSSYQFDLKNLKAGAENLLGNTSLKMWKEGESVKIKIIL